MTSELDWLIGEINSEIQTSLLIGLNECQERLGCRDRGFKLVVSSPKSDALIGIVTRCGTELLECDLTVKLHTVNKGQIFSVKLKPDKSYPLLQTVDVVNLLSEAKDGLKKIVKNGLQQPIKGGELLLRQLKISLTLIHDSLLRIEEPQSVYVYPLHATDLDLFQGMPDGVAVEFYTKDSSVYTDIRNIRDLDETSTTFETLTSVFGTRKKPTKTIFYGTKSVYELERITVASQDPNLISLAAKLSAVEKQLETMKSKLQLCLQVTREEGLVAQ